MNSPLTTHHSLLVLDNYDSFTYNLVHRIEKITGAEVDVFRNNEIALEAIAGYDKIILSPGPGLPKDAGILLQVIKRYAATKSILGVCLGHQAIGEAFGAKLVNLPQVYHGVASVCNIFSDHFLFKDLPGQIEVGRYHSWVIDEETFPKSLEITARDEHGNIMALQHKTYDLCGVQFHPESILTPCGEKMLSNWLMR